MNHTTSTTTTTAVPNNIHQNNNNAPITTSNDDNKWHNNHPSGHWPIEILISKLNEITNNDSDNNNNAESKKQIVSQLEKIKENKAEENELNETLRECETFFTININSQNNNIVMSEIKERMKWWSQHLHNREEVQNDATEKIVAELSFQQGTSASSLPDATT